MGVYQMLLDQEGDRQNRWDVEKEQWSNYEFAFMSDEASAMLCAKSPTELKYLWLFFSGVGVVYNSCAPHGKTIKTFWFVRVIYVVCNT